MQRDIKWMQWIAFFIPLGGILFSAALVVRNDEEAAKRVGVVALVTSVVKTSLLFLFLIGTRRF